MSKDSFQDIQEENGLIAGLIGLVGVGLLASGGIAIAKLEKVTVNHDAALFVLLTAMALILLSALSYKWMMFDTKQQFKQQLPVGKFRFWLKASSKRKCEEAKGIVARHGGHMVGA